MPIDGLLHEIFKFFRSHFAIEIIERIVDLTKVAWPKFITIPDVMMILTMAADAVARRVIGVILNGRFNDQGPAFRNHIKFNQARNQRVRLPVNLTKLGVNLALFIGKSVERHSETLLTDHKNTWSLRSHITLERTAARKIQGVAR